MSEEKQKHRFRNTALLAGGRAQGHCSRHSETVGPCRVVHPRQHSRGCLRRAEGKRSERPRPSRIAGRDTGRHRLRYGQDIECCGAAVDDTRHRRPYSRRGHDGAWDTAWNTADIALVKDLYVIQLRRTGKGCLSYLIGSGREAAVLDASLEPQIYRELAADRGWRITRVVETHIHADHLSRSRRLAEMSAAELHLPEQDRVSFRFIAIRDGDFIPIGATGLKALRTPGLHS